MKKYKNPTTGKVTVEVYDLSFLRDKEHPYGWLKRHFLHFRLKYALWRADCILVKTADIGVDLIRYYFVPKEKISVNTMLRSDVDKA